MEAEIGTNQLQEQVLEALRLVVDPELGVNVVDLGLIHRLEIDGDRGHVEMILTSPACPLGSFLQAEAEATVREHVPGLRTFSLELVAEPRWDPDRMTESARQQLGWHT